jgi:Xaa-Pro dipeptidase
MVIVAGAKGEEVESTLFVPLVDLHYLTWNGRATPLEDWAKFAKTTSAKYITERDEHLEKLMKDGLLKKSFVLDDKVLDGIKEPILKSLKETAPADGPQRLKSAFAKARASKFEGEIELMRRVSKLSGEGHVELMRCTHVRGMNEAQLDASFQYYCCMRGCRHMAYTPIVGSGPRSAILHYNTNNNAIRDGDLVLIDAGAELRGYAADITRTFPANGKFSAEQRLIYEIVLNAQKKAIEGCVIGLDFVKDLMASTALNLLEGLIKNYFVRGVTAKEAFDKKLHRLFMPHGLGHLVGLDVHDCNVYPEFPLEEDTFITIEPGIYFNPYLLRPAFEKVEESGAYLNRDLIERYMDFGGVRIEDIVHVTKDGPKVITSSAPKEFCYKPNSKPNSKHPITQQTLIMTCPSEACTCGTTCTCGESCKCGK